MKSEVIEAVARAPLGDNPKAIKRQGIFLNVVNGTTRPISPGEQRLYRAVYGNPSTKDLAQLDKVF